MFKLLFVALLLIGSAAVAEESGKYVPYVPADKKLDPAWVKSLFARGERKVYSDEELKYLAMPCGGIGAGQIAILGDGTLGTWWIFNELQDNDANGAHYLHPVVPDRRLENGFAVRIEEEGKPAEVLRLDGKTFDGIRFIGEYPIATIEYLKSGKALPVKIQSEVFSPFVPLNVRDSANPVTVFRFEVTNTTDKNIKVTLGGWLQNAPFSPLGGNRENRVLRDGGLTTVLLGATPSAPDARGKGHPQFGDLAIGVLDAKADASASCGSADDVLINLREGRTAGPESKDYPGNATTCGSVASELSLKPGETKSCTFLVTWYFPNLYNQFPGCPGLVGHIYNNWYRSSFDVAKYVAANFDRLYRDTRLFRDTYFDSTLPYWLLQRIGMPVSTLAADNYALWENGRMYALEGVGFCFGTCGHVQNFVAATSRLFPELERSVRRMQDLGPGFDPDSGRVNFRGHDGPNPTAGHAYASDAQSGYVLKIYREHLMSPDNRFLDEVWPKVKRIIGYHIFLDGAERGLEPNGVLEGLQTFWDPMWYGPNPYNNTLYLAALRAAEEMARIKGETKLADRYHEIYESGRKYMGEQMWNGEYFMHLYPEGFEVVHSDKGVVSPRDQQGNAKRYIDAFNSGLPNYYRGGACDANQLFGQNWANQLGLGYILPPDRCRTAAHSIFLYNWTPDISTVYRLYPPKNRTLAAPGEGAMVNGSWPKVKRQPFENIHDKDDIWTGLEYEAACDMLNEGLLQEGLTVIRATHDRYNARKRNPWNEIEGWDHYSRAMHSWNVLLVLGGYVYDGPAGKIGFAPRMTPENFNCFFSAAEGWGQFSQNRDGAAQHSKIEVRYGRLRIKTLLLTSPSQAKSLQCIMTSAGKPVAGKVYLQDGRATIRLETEIVLQAGDTIDAELR